MRPILALVTAVGLAMGLMVPAMADDGIDPTNAHTISVVDPLADHTGPVDVVGMVMDFDPLTGDYEIVLRSDSAAPFDSDFRVNINLFNPDDQSVFRDTVNDFSLSEPTTTLNLVGTSDALKGWEIGDRVFTNSLAGTPNPPGTTLYRSGVSGFPVEFLTNEDVIAFSDLSQPAFVESLSPQIRASRLMSEVEALVQNNALTQDQADGLLNKLRAVISSLEDGRVRPAVNQLNAFINQVEAFIPRKLTAEQGGLLLHEATVIDSQLRE